MILEIARGSLRYVGAGGRGGGGLGTLGSRRVVQERAATVRGNGEPAERGRGGTGGVGGWVGGWMGGWVTPGEGEEWRAGGRGFAERGLRLGCLARAGAGDRGDDCEA